MKGIEPGCMAMVINSPKYFGMIVHVIERAIPPEHEMPNGTITCCGENEWIIELPEAIPCPYYSGETGMVSMGAANERFLMRIDDPDVAVTEDREESALS